MDYENMSTEDLILEYKKQKSIANINKIKQMQLKIGVNSIYGFVGNVHTRFYKKEIAEGITLTGQTLLKRIERDTNVHLNSLIGTENVDYVITQDTDSVAGDSIVYANNDKIKIEDLYNKFSEYVYQDEFNKSYVKPVFGLTTKSLNTATQEVEDKQIKYIMKHRVKKKMYRIHVDDTYVDVTEDHSVIVYRNYRYMSVKPDEIDTQDDILITIAEKTKNYRIVCLGEIEIDVYDIEVDDNHNFFANDILVHNSSYICLNNLVDKFVPKDSPKDKIVEFLDRFHKAKIAPKIKEITDKMQTDMNVFSHRLKFVRDVIADVGIFLVKKRYILQVWDSEGVRYGTPDLKMMGIETKKSSTPQYCKDRMVECIDIMVNGNNDKLISKIDSIKSEFFSLEPHIIASPRGITDIDKWVINGDKDGSMFSDKSESEITYKSGCPIHVKAAISHNKIIKKKNLDTKYPNITNGDKIRYIYLKNPNPIGNNAIAFDGKLPKEFGLDEYIDYNTQFEKSFLDPIKAIANVIGWNVEKTSAYF